METKILVIDTGHSMDPTVAITLGREGYVVSTATGRADGLRQMILDRPNLALLALSGQSERDLETCRLVRELSNIPLILITSDGELLERVKGLEAGADDCVSQRSSPQELVARVRALLRRVERLTLDEKSTILQAGDLSINLVSHDVTVRGRPINLTPREFRLLSFLVENANRALSGEELLRHVWGPEYKQRADYPKIYIRSLRKKLGDTCANSRYIQSIHGVGYRLAVPTVAAE